MNYVVPYTVLKANFLRLEGSEAAEGADVSHRLSEETLMAIARQFLQSVAIDEAWYLTTYTDVADAIAEGVFRSARHHFMESGYFEGRLPGELTVDEAWYAQCYPDVADGVEEGYFSSLAQHFHEHGYREGRRPFPL